MISQDDINAFADDLETADRVAERAQTGVPAGRHIHANEEMSLIRAFVIMREAAMQAGAFMADQHKRELQGLDINRDT